MLSSPQGRAFFQLEPLPAEIVVTLGVIAGAWTLAVVLIHHTRIVQRGIDRAVPARECERPGRAAVLSHATR